MISRYFSFLSLSKNLVIFFFLSFSDLCVSSIPYLIHTRKKIPFPSSPHHILSMSETLPWRGIITTNSFSSRS